jgi:tRNA-specific 2-thiouridylase
VNAAKKRIYTGLSGGVDSSVAAALLAGQGYEVTGVYMKNWSQDLPGHHCPWEEDYKDAKRVAVKLGIDFKLFDFQKQYRQKVVDYMINEYKAGRTPNPDVMCNQEIKFKLFLDTALEDGADMIATGHYARVERAQAHSSQLTAHSSCLLRAKDKNKDQSYFLYRVTGEALAKTLMPIGEFTSKDEVRKLAKKFGLPTAEKKDSQGICFVGKVGIKDFLSQYVDTKPGPIVDSSGKQIGEHDGAIFYTIGQRHGLGIGGRRLPAGRQGGLPYYVTKKDMATNTVYVTTDLDDKNLWGKKITLENIHWINPVSHTNSQLPTPNSQLKVCLRYRGPLVGCEIEGNKLVLDDEQRAISAGQSAVIYDGERCLGGGIIISTP